MKTIAQTRHLLITRFTIRFALFTIALFGLVNTLPDVWLTIPLNRLTASLTGFILSLFGLPAIVKGVELSYAGFSIKIILECTAIHVILLFVAFVLSYPASGRQKSSGLLFGSAILFLANLFRIAAIFILGLNSRSLFQYAHVYIGQIFMVMLLILISLQWLKSFLGTSVKDSPLHFFSRFFIISFMMFFVWLFLAKPFVYVNYLLVKAVLIPLQSTLSIPNSIKLYPHTFNTFHIAGFAALILSTKSIDWEKKWKGVFSGLFLLWAVYFLFLLLKTLLFSLNVKSAEIPFVAFILINQWILPFGLWIAIVRKEIFKPVGIYECPICGLERNGIIDHIRGKHGETTLSSPKVHDFLKKEGIV